MTHLDDQVAKHIKKMIRKIRQKPTEDRERLRKPDTINQIVRTRKGTTERKSRV